MRIENFLNSDEKALGFANDERVTQPLLVTELLIEHRPRCTDQRSDLRYPNPLPSLLDRKVIGGPKGLITQVSTEGRSQRLSLRFCCERTDRL